MSRRVCVLGAGRFGRALAVRLRPSCQVALADAEPRRTKQFAKQHDLGFLYPREIGAWAELIAVCVPPQEVARALREPARQGTGALCVNMATSVPTRELAADPGLRGLRLAGLKPVGQFTAVARGVPALFVTASTEHHPLLREVFGGLGEVVVGDEDAVAAVNRTATAHALRACDALTAELARTVPDDRVVRAAVRNVFAGTALDYPPDPANPYIAALRAAMAAEGSPR